MEAKPCWSWFYTKDDKRWGAVKIAGKGVRLTDFGARTLTATRRSAE